FRRLKVRGQVAVVRRSDTVSAPDQAAAAAKAGARQLLILNDGYGKLDAWADLVKGAPLPVASLGTDDSARLLSRLRGHGTATLKVVSHPYPRYLYDLIRRHDGAVPKDPSYRPRPGDLARIDESFRNTSQAGAVEYREDASLVGGSMQLQPTQVAAQGTLTSWVTAGDGTRWISAAAMPDLNQRGEARTYKPRSTISEAWFAPIQRPRVLNDGINWTAPFRVGDVISTSTLPAWGDSGGHAGLTWADGDTSKVSLYQGDQLLGEAYNEWPVTAEEVSPDPQLYRIVVEGKRDLPDRPYSTRTRTEWGFTSSTTDYSAITPLPLVQLDYAVATDLSGKAKRRTALTVTASHLKGAAGAGAIRTVNLEVSYDDGATWRRTTLRQSGGGWKAQLDAPSRARFASLRTTARDSKGNSVSQTLIRAFGIK
ncbi:peptidase, partial [Streptomyces sp. PA03-6a]|nr:peptidase [Streptomyces sp. PA03-6a]